MTRADINADMLSALEWVAELWGERESVHPAAVCEKWSAIALQL